MSPGNPAELSRVAQSNTGQRIVRTDMPDPQAVFKKECRKRIARQKKRVLRFLLLSVALTLACGVMIGVSYLFRIRGVEITGNSRCSAEELLAAAEIRIGAPLSSLDEKALSDKLTERYVWIRNASVEKSLFGKVRIRVTEYTAAYTVRAENGDYLVSEDFTVLERVGGDPDVTLPVLLLPTGRNAVIGEACNEWKEEPTAAAGITAALKNTEDFLRVTAIDLGSRYYYRLRCEDGLTVILGDTDSLSVKLELAAAVLAENAGKSWSHAEINVSDVKKATFRIAD